MCAPKNETCLFRRTYPSEKRETNHSDASARELSLTIHPNTISAEIELIIAYSHILEICLDTPLMLILEV